jgi:putative oxidoreductase
MTFRESSTSFAGTTGVERFTRIGFSRPAFTAHFGGTFEIVCGLLVLAGLWTRIAAIPLLIVICAAIVTTKIPELTHAGQGFWFRVSDTRTDCAMLMCLLFLIVSGYRNRVETASSGLSQPRGKEPQARRE